MIEENWEIFNAEIIYQKEDRYKLVLKNINCEEERI